MLKRLSPRERFEQLVATWEPLLRAAFMEAIYDIRSNIVLRRIVERLERQDVSGAVALLDLDRDDFARLELAILEAYNAGGQSTVEMMPSLKDPEGNRILFRWGVRNLTGEQELRLHAASLVTGIVDDTREGLREILATSLAEGRNPHRAGLDMVGRINRVTGKREGGLLGLTAQQMRTAAWIQKAMRDGDVEKMREYLGLNLRDQRFDRSVAKAIRESTALPDEMANRIFVQYSNRALNHRGKVLARHETMVALDTSRDDAFQQQIDAGKLIVSDIKKSWHHTPREHPRIQHMQMVGQTVGYEEEFVAPDGTRLRYPRDPRAPARHTLGCFCRAEYKIDHIGSALRRYQARMV